MRSSLRFVIPGLALLVGAVSISCGDQAFVSYIGTVAEADVDQSGSAEFADAPPENAQPIADASVSLCAQSKCRATSNETGLWGPAWESFPLFSDRDIRLTVSAEGYESFTYVARYPSTDDPIYADRLLNVRLRRLAQDAQDGGQ